MTQTGNYKTANINTPAISSSATALATNAGRIGWQIQNLGTATLFVNIGGTATTSVFHTVLKGGTGNDDGLGGSYSEMFGAVSTGAITVASGGTIRYTVIEKSVI